MRVHKIHGLVDAASRGRLMGNWGIRTSSATGEVYEDLSILRSRASHMRRNDPWISRAIYVTAVNEIGTGIRPSPDTGDDELNRQLRDLHDVWHHHSDYQGTLNVFGIQASMVLARKEAGECFLLIRRNRMDSADDSPVPLEFQLVEADQLARDLNSLNHGGNVINAGVETTKNGKIVAYWFHSSHPSDATIKLKGSTTANRVRVPKKDVIHHFRPDRPTQMSARPEVTKAIIRARNFEEYTEAETVRKKVRADLTGTIEKAADENDGNPFTGDTEDEEELDQDDTPIVDFQQGTFTELRAGEKLNLFPADQTGQGFDEYQRWQLLGIAAAIGIPYQLLTLDYSNINDRVWRAILNNYKRELQHNQELYIIPQICRRMWIEFVKRAVATGVIVLPDGMPLHQAYRARFRPQSFEFINPSQDVKAKIDLVTAGFKSRTAIVDEISTGDESAADVDAQRVIDKEREEELGLTMVEADPENDPNNDPNEQTDPKSK